MKKRIGIVAKKLSHSLSPIIHNEWIKKNNINAEYICFEIKESELQSFYDEFKRDKNFLGFNVTVPYKENFFHMCNNISKQASSIGSLNLIYKKNNLIYGDNTDYIGFAKTYKKIINKKIQSTLLIGAGGAARSVLKFLNDQKIEHIDILARTKNKKRSLSEIMKFENFYTETNNVKEKKYDLIINASDAGMKNKKQLDKEIYKLIPLASYAIDIIYNPLSTKFLKVAKKAQTPHIGGLNMLLEQAKPSFDRWFGSNVEITKNLESKLIRKLKK